jgi:hypothetical protein
MSQQKPKRPAKPKPRKLNLNPKTTWKNILKEVDKKEVPIQVLERMIVYLIDGTEVDIPIKELLATGADPDVVEKQINKKLEDLDQYVQNVDFFVDIESVEKTIQPETDRILAKL